MTSGKRYEIHVLDVFFILFLISMYDGVYNNIIGTPGIQKAFVALTYKIPDDPCKPNVFERWNVHEGSLYK